MSDSDWDSVTVLHKKTTAASVKGKNPINSNVVSVAKGDQTNKQGSAHVVAAWKLDNETEPGSLPTTGLELKTLIQQTRTAMKLTQQDLANKTNGKVTAKDIQEIEQGKWLMNMSKLKALEKVMKVHLTGTNIGKSM
jgi:ribosome-binding protein aMBF1 (putative translation factor)